MKCQGVVKAIRIKANDIDKYISVTFDLEQNADTNKLTELMLKAVNIEVTLDGNCV
mgnify:CR=1 FL=1